MTEKRALKTRIRDYFKRKSTFSLISDGIFVVLVVLLIIPSTRKEISAFAIRLTMSSPGMAEDITRIDEQDYHWPLKTLDGKQIDFTRFSDQVIFLNRWATWCPPCIAEMPSIQDLYKDYGKKVAFVLVSNEEPETVKKFMEKKGFTFPVYISEYRAPKPFQTNTLPTTYLVSDKGHIVVNKKGVANWNSEKMRSMIDELIK